MDATLRNVLARYPTEVSPLNKPEPLGNAGGLSGAQLWRFPAPRGLMALRAWPEDGPGRDRIERIHHWLARAARLPFVPVPITDREGRTLVEAAGRFWEVAPWLPGAPEVARPPAPTRLRAAFTALARFHEVFADERREGISPGLAARLEELEGLLIGGFDRLEASIRGAGDDPAAEAARRWLGLARQLGPSLRRSLRRRVATIVRLQPCLRDARPEHFLFDDDHLTGLVDYGAMGVECVLGDLVRLLTEFSVWIGDPARYNEAMSAYFQGRTLPLDEALLLNAFAHSSALLSGGHWVRWHFVEGRTFDQPGAVSEGIDRSVDHLARLAAWQLIP